MTVEIRRATSDDDRRLVLEIAHAANGVSAPLAFYQARRLASPLRRRAVWWLLFDGGEAVSTLLCYDLHFARGDERVAGFGFGSVATRPEARRHGHASSLCRAVAEEARGRGRPLGLLFSAIPPALYARLGFAPLASHDWCCDDPAALAASGPLASLWPLDPVAALDMLVRRYDGARSGWRLHRDAATWRRSLQENAQDVFFELGPGEGYVRVVDGDGELEVVELVAEPDRAAEALRALGALAVGLGRTRVRGWLWPEQVPASHFVDWGRSWTLPMMSGVGPDETAWFVSSDYF